jgi:hypothetical protein
MDGGGRAVAKMGLTLLQPQSRRALQTLRREDAPAVGTRRAAVWGVQRVREARSHSSLSLSTLAARLKRQRNVTVLRGEVVDLDADRWQVFLRQGGCLTYDTLIVAAGSSHSYFTGDLSAQPRGLPADAPSELKCSNRAVRYS